MPQLSNHVSKRVTKMLLIGDSGSGKTGALASLAKAGYNLRILDFDNGLDILLNLLAGDSPALARVIFETCTDKLHAVGGNVVPKGIPTAWPRAMGLLTNWKVGSAGNPAATPPVAASSDYYSLGSLETWTDKDVLVIDSLTYLGKAALRYVLAMNNRSDQAPHQADWGTAMKKVEEVLSLLYSDSVPCNVIITSHVTFIGEEGTPLRGYPSALGQKLPPTVGRYFNTILATKCVGSGANSRRTIRTASEGFVELKHPFPGKVPLELPLDTGLATFFEIARKG